MESTPEIGSYVVYCGPLRGSFGSAARVTGPVVDGRVPVEYQRDYGKRGIRRQRFAVRNVCPASPALIEHHHLTYVPEQPKRRRRK